VKARRAVVFSALLLLIAAACDAGLGFVARRDQSSKRNWVFGLKGRDVDYIVLGSSRAYRIIDVMVVDSEIAGRGLNLGQDGASYPEMALLFDVFLQQNRARRLLLEIDEFGLDSASFSHPFHEYSYIPYQRDTIVSRALREYFGARALLWRYVPMFAYAEFNDRLGPKNLARAWRAQKPEFDSTGFAPSRGGVPESIFDSARDTAYRVSGVRLRGLERILETAKARGIAVTMFTSTEYLPFQQSVRNRDQLFARHAEIGRAYGASFLAVSDSDIAVDRQLFRDPRHLNYAGAQLFSRRLGRALRAQWTHGNDRDSTR
jgi:hypothetical protein